MHRLRCFSYTSYGSILLGDRLGIFYPLLRSYASSSTSAAENGDYYDVLGVDKNATTKDIKAAYYELSKKYHPDTADVMDKNETAKRFHELTEAYDTLGNVDKRRAYDDRMNHAPSAGHDPFDDPDLATLREFQRKWNLRRQHYTPRGQPPKTDSMNDVDFEAFFRRYKQNLAKDRMYEAQHQQEEAIRHNYSQYRQHERMTDFQKDMLRRKHKTEKEYSTSMVALTAFFTAMLLVMFIVMGR